MQMLWFPMKNIQIKIVQMEIVLVETLLVYTYSKNPELIYELS